MIFKAVKRLALACVAALIGLVLNAPMSRADTVASLLGNFTINQFCDLQVETTTIDVHYAVVYGQLPALRELHNADADGNGITTQIERDAYVGKLAPAFADGLELVVDGVRLPLRAARWTSSLPAEQGGFSLRVDVDLNAVLDPAHLGIRHVVQFSNRNYPGKMGWHEIVVTPATGVAVYDTDGFSTSVTGGLKEALAALPAAGPLDERTVHLSFDRYGIPHGATSLTARLSPGSPRAGAGVATSSIAQAESGWITRKTRGLIDAISAPKLELSVALWALLGALFLGAVHALSPGHGKTIVGAYLIGSRGTPRHALFLGFTVTVTHTFGVFLLGFATLYASRFVVPERLFPILSLVSALLVLGMGVVLLVQRGRAAARKWRSRAWGGATVFFPVDQPLAESGFGNSLLLAHQRDHVHDNGDGHFHSHADGTMHSHGGGPIHSHLPPGASGERVTWKSLVTLGISGGLVPCPSAMVLLLAAVALNKTAYGMLLVLVFSLGLAITLTVVGLLFLYARNRFRRPGAAARWPQLLPVLSAATITVLGAALCFGALKTFV